jgi:uncharacterized membrane protein (DUF441 family)
MDKKFDNGSFVALALLITTFLASFLSGRALEWLEFEPTMMNSIIAGTVIGLPIFIALFLIMVLIASVIRRKN